MRVRPPPPPLRSGTSPRGGGSEGSGRHPQCPLDHSLRGPVFTLSQWAIDNIVAIHGAQGTIDEAGEVARVA